MNATFGALLVLFFLAGGAWGWWKGTNDLATPPDRQDRPMGMGRREFQRQLRRRYKRRRILLTLGGGAFSLTAGFMLLLFLASPTTAPKGRPTPQRR